MQQKQIQQDESNYYIKTLDSLRKKNKMMTDGVDLVHEFIWGGL